MERSKRPEVRRSARLPMLSTSGSRGRIDRTDTNTKQFRDQISTLKARINSEVLRAAAWPLNRPLTSLVLPFLSVWSTVLNSPSWLDWCLEEEEDLRGELVFWSKEFFLHLTVVNCCFVCVYVCACLVFSRRDGQGRQWHSATNLAYCHDSSNASIDGFLTWIYGGIFYFMSCFYIVLLSFLQNYFVLLDI